MLEILRKPFRKITKELKPSREERFSDILKAFKETGEIELGAKMCRMAANDPILLTYLINTSESELYTKQGNSVYSRPILRLDAALFDHSEEMLYEYWDRIFARLIKRGDVNKRFLAKVAQRTWNNPKNNFLYNQFIDPNVKYFRIFVLPYLLPSLKKLSSIRL